MESVYLTHEGLRKVQAELNRLVNEVRPVAAQAMADARAKGDLSENAEFDAAREELHKLDRQIVDLQRKIAHVHIIDEDEIASDEVRILSEVTVVNLKTDRNMKFIIVDQLQADPARQLISVQSPIAKGLLGRKVGDEVEIEVPSGRVEFRILSIARSTGL